MSSLYDCSPETNNTKVKVYTEKTSDVIKNITGIFILFTSIGITSLFILAINQATSMMKLDDNPLFNTLVLILFALVVIIVGLIGLYHKLTNISIFGFTSFILIGTYIIFLGISGKLNNINFINIMKYIKESVLGAVGIIVALVLAQVLGYGKFKKTKNKQKNKNNKQKQRLANSILPFSLVGSILLVYLVASYKVYVSP